VASPDRKEGRLTVRGPLPTHVRDLPRLPPGYDEVLEAGLARLGIVLTAAARTAIDDHVRLLLAWTDSINLTAIRDPIAAATLHVLDSLSAVPLILTLAPGRLLDLGSGAGYPGLPLAAATTSDALLVESIGKKARFLEVAIEATRMRPHVRVATVRAEALADDPGERGRWPLVTARAVGSMPDLIELALPLLEIGGTLLAWKRGDLTDELEAGERASRALGGGPARLHRVEVPGLEGHVLVAVRKRRPTPLGYPREPAVRDRRPW
jgi:16S rRNA (guanine527-N7)-methyltransferase